MQGPLNLPNEAAMQARRRHKTLLAIKKPSHMSNDTFRVSKKRFAKLHSTSISIHMPCIFQMHFVPLCFGDR